MDVSDRADLIYHETQQAALCGVHAINALLQASHFSEIELAQIALELDAAERALMASGGVESAEYLQYMAEESGNVAENGMFSIQVLSRGLEVFGLQAVPLTSPDPAAAAARADPTTQEAFICHLEEHWFTVRKIHDQWWNLNSVYSAPEPLSAFHLAAYLGSLQEQGYTIFVVLGPLPPSHPPASDEERAVPGMPGRWWSPEEARAATQEKEQLKKAGFAQAVTQGVLDKAGGGQGTWVTLRRPGAKRAHDEDGSGGSALLQGGGGDDTLARALAASLADSDRPRSRHAGAWGAAPPGAAADDEDADLAAAIAASLADGAGGPPSNQQQEQEGQQQQGEVPMSEDLTTDFGAPDGSGDDMDAELAAAIAASLSQPATADEEAPAVPAGEQQQQQQQQVTKAPALQLPELASEPEAGAEGAVEVALRLPGGGRASRRFSAASDCVGHLAAFAAEAGADMAACQLSLQFPRRVLGDWEQSLDAAGVGHKVLVTVEPKTS